jgi:hypothetical protein
MKKFVLLVSGLILVLGAVDLNTADSEPLHDKSAYGMPEAEFAKAIP